MNYFEFKNELKFYNLEAWLICMSCLIDVMWLLVGCVCPRDAMG